MNHFSKGGVYDTRKTGQAFRGAEERNSSSASRLRSTLVYEWIALNGPGAVDVLDEQDFVADLVIEELVNGTPGKEETEAAGW